MEGTDIRTCLMRKNKKEKNISEVIIKQERIISLATDKVT